MSGLRLAPDLRLPVEAATETFAILGKRGSGKTSTAVVMVEEMVDAGQPVVVLDPIGVWWGLRSSASGTDEGLPVVIFGGDHADVPLERTAGELIANVIIDQRISAVLDLSLLSKTAARTFVADFLERLYHRNREALHVVVDEADLFAPQRAVHGAERLLGSMEDMVRRGRARGIGVTLITQRPASLHKDVLSQAEVLVCLRMTGPRDVAAIDEWVRLHADEDEARAVKASLPSLAVGQAWFWSPGWLGILKQVVVRPRRTFDSSATPKAGQRVRAPKRMAQVDIQALGEQITATVEKAKADDPCALRARIAELERAAAVVPEPVIERIEVSVLTDEDRDALPKLIGSMVGLHQSLADLIRRAETATQNPHQERNEGSSPARRSAPGAHHPDVRPVARGRQVAPITQERPAAGQREMRPAPAAGTLRAGARRMVESLGRMAPLRLTTGQWGMVAHLKTTGGTWSTYLSELRRAGLVEQDSAGWTLTDAGFDYIGGQPDPMTGGELQDHYRTILRAGAVKMLDALIDEHPGGLTRDQLGERAGIATTGGTFSTYLGELIRNQLAERDGDLVTATEILMYGAQAHR